MPKAEELLCCTLTYRNAEVRATPLQATLPTRDAAVEEMKRVLLHEAHEAMQEPLTHLPEHLYLHPVDVDTDEPGIVDRERSGDDPTERECIRRYDPAQLQHVQYRTTSAMVVAADDVPPPPLPAKSRKDTQEDLTKALAKAEKQAATAERRAQRQQEAKEARARETPEEREARLVEAREKRAERKRIKEERENEVAAAAAAAPAAPPPPPAPPAVEENRPAEEDEVSENDPKTTAAVLALAEEIVLSTDDHSSFASFLRPVKKRKRGDKARYFEHPLPHHRHLQALQWSRPADPLLPALLRGEECEELEIIQGPPGTGKTRALVRRIRAFGPDARILLCAPTNVGACNLYARCLAEGFGDQAALALVPERIPVGTYVQSNDVRRRIVCATISGRAGPMLTSQRFDAVLVDEAAQCMEAWVWSLLREEVQCLVLAGDVRQLPAQVSESGKPLRHERSLMERLVVDLQYSNVITLTEQNRMAPALLAYPNRVFYDGVLTTGPRAPRDDDADDIIQVLHVEDGCEEASGTSYCNRAEASAIAAAIARQQQRKSGADEDDRGKGAEEEQVDTNHAKPSVVILSPYTAQCRCLLAQKTGCEVHTIDSFQGREADVIYLSVVRDGSQGLGFWEDDRRLTVALTRARRKLVVAVSTPMRWPRTSRLTEWVDEHARNCVA